jgi:hypothetical protein
MRENFKLLFAVTFVLAIAFVLLTVCFQSQRNSLGELSTEVMQSVYGGGNECSNGCAIQSFLCNGDGFQFSANCVGCAAVTDGQNPTARIVLGTYEQGEEIKSGPTTKTPNAAVTVNCTAITTCDYAQKPDGYRCNLVNQMQSCQMQGTICPGEICYNVSGNPPTVWNTKTKGTCIDP